MAKQALSVLDLVRDPNNFNRGTSRGKELLKSSVDQVGFGRSIVVSSDDVVLAGNHTMDEAKARGVNIKVVETDGDELVVVKRTDLHSNDPKATKLAVLDNRTGQLNLDLDTREIEVTAEQFDIDLGDLGFTDLEIEALPGTPGAGTPHDRDDDDDGDESLDDDSQNKGSTDSSQIGKQFNVMVVFTTEAEQRAMYERLLAEKHNVRVVNL